MLDPTQRHRLQRHPAFPVVVLCVSLALNLLAAWVVARAVRTREETSFEAAVNATTDYLGAEMEAFSALLAGFASAYDQNTTRKDAAAAMARLRLSRWPAELPSPIVAVATFSLGERPFDPAMRRARDSGGPALSPRVMIEGQAPGFVLYVPLYTRGPLPETLEERRDRFIGVVYAAISAEQLFAAIFGSDGLSHLAIEVFDGELPAPSSALYASMADVDDDNARWHAVRTLDVAGRRWLLRYFARPVFSTPLERTLPPALGIGGVLVSFVLFAFARSQLNARRAAEESNEERDATLIKKQELRAEADATSAVLDSLFRATPAGLAVFDRELRYLRVNQGLSDIDGVPVAEHLGRRVADVFPALDTPVSEAAKHVLETGEAVTVEISAKVPGGPDVRTWLANFAPARAPSGELVGIAQVLMDITEPKEERETLAALNRLGKSITAELDPDALAQIVIDEATHLCGAELGAFFYKSMDSTGVGDVLHAVAGASPEAFARFSPRPHGLFASVHTDDTIVRIDDLLEGGPQGQEAPFVDRDGLPPVRSYMTVPVVSPAGGVIGHWVFGHTERAVFSARAENAVGGLAAQAAIAMDNAKLFRDAAHLIHALERSNEDLDQFAYVASHDLKAPLRGIASVCDWIEEDLGPSISEETRRHLHLLRGRIKRLDALIEGMLRFARASRRDDEREDLEVRKVVEEAVALLSPPPEARISIVPPLPKLRASRTLLQQVFLNLIGNAMKYGGGAAEISARELGKAWEFAVRDEGPGISPEFHEKIWGIFQTLQPRDKIEGTGIGLSIVRKIVLDVGGRAWVDSEKGVGATFRFTWPK